MSTDVAEQYGFGDPLEIVLKDPGDYLNLYNYTFLLDSHPVRIVIPVIAGFNKAVKLAVALNFAVKLEIRQPDRELLKEVEGVLDFYLHRSHVRQPIDFFHTTLTSFFYNDPITLWEINEETPATAEKDQECEECEFFNRCGGYFKQPDRTYRCDGIKRIFQTLANAAEEMTRDLATFEKIETGEVLAAPYLNWRRSHAKAAHPLST